MSRVLLVLAALALCLTADAGPTAAQPDPNAAAPPILVSRQMLRELGARVGDVVLLSAHQSGADARPFRVAGVYEPTPDPTRLTARRIEARLHLPDLIRLKGDAQEPAAGEQVTAINVALADPADAEAFARDLTVRVPGLVVRPTARPDDSTNPFVALERFHLAIAIVTVLGSTIFLLALMVMLADERRETVGTLRLIGVTRRRVLLQVFVEGLLIAAAGAAFGILLAAAAEGAFNRFFQWRYDTALVFVHITPDVAWRSIALSVPLGILAAVAASWTLLRRRILALVRR